MCDDVIRRDLYSLQYVPDWFFTRDWVDMSCDDYYDDDDNHSWCDWYDKFFEWHESYQKRKAQKASITEELLPIAWHPSRYWDWCMSEDEKKNRKIMGINIGFLCLMTGYKDILTTKELKNKDVVFS